jgi:erythromycin esterase
MPEAYRVNDYVVNGNGDPKELLEGMYFWTWNTQEVLEMILWMRKFNQSGRGRIQFLGFDMQTGQEAVKIVSDFVRKIDPSYVPVVDRLKACLDSVVSLKRQSKNVQLLLREIIPICDDVVRHLAESRSGYTAVATVAEVDWVIQNATIIAQAKKLEIAANNPNGPAIRDSSMAFNVGWILDHSPADSRIVLWAHNGHIAKGRNKMGWYLNERYGDKYLAIAQTCNAGFYTAHSRGKGLRSDNVIAPSLPASFEGYCHDTGMPMFALDVRGVHSGSQASGWLSRPILMRTIGAFAMNQQQVELRVPEEFDMVIYFEETRASKCFGIPKARWY